MVSSLHFIALSRRCLHPITHMGLYSCMCVFRKANNTLEVRQTPGCHAHVKQCSSTSCPFVGSYVSQNTTNRQDDALPLFNFPQGDFSISCTRSYVVRQWQRLGAQLHCCLYAPELAAASSSTPAPRLAAHQLPLLYSARFQTWYLRHNVWGLQLITS